MNVLRKYIVPGLIFQSVIIGGGYATGRELIEFFFASGPVGGVLGLLVSGLVFGLVLAIAFEFARSTESFDYGSFCRNLLGRFWILFEIAFICLMVLILSVVGSASGELVASAMDLPQLVGTIGMMVLVGALTFMGSEAIGKFLSAWSILLYTVYILLFILAFSSFGSDIAETYASAPNTGDWFTSGVLYSGYNLAVVPIILFAVVGHKSRRETFGAGAIGGLLAVIPAILFFVALMAKYPEVNDQPVPATFLMSSLDIGWLNVMFQIVVFGTFVETGAALLHGLNERLDHSFEERGKTLPAVARPLLAVLILFISIFAASAIGIINLIGSGYNFLTLVFIAVLVIPLLTRGVWLIYKSEKMS